KSSHGREAADTHWRDRGFGPAADHHFGFAALDDSHRITHRMRAGGARGGRCRIRTLGAGTDRNLACRQVDDGRRNEERGYAPGPFFEASLVLALDDFESANAAADQNAGTLRILWSDLVA